MSVRKTTAPQPLHPLVQLFDSTHKSYLYLKGWIWNFPMETAIPRRYRILLGEMRLRLGWQLTWLQEHLIYEHQKNFPSEGVGWVRHSLGKLGVKMGDCLLPTGHTGLYQDLVELTPYGPGNLSEYCRIALPTVMAIDFMRLRK